MEDELQCPACREPSGLFSHRWGIVDETLPCRGCKAPVTVRVCFMDEEDIEGHWWLEHRPASPEPQDGKHD